MVRRLLSFGNVFTTLWSGYYLCVVMLLPLCGNHITKVLVKLYGGKCMLISDRYSKIRLEYLGIPFFYCNLAA